MDLVVGNEYYWLEESDFISLSSTYSELANYFFPGPDGYYYAETASLEATDFDDILFELELLQSTYYSKSNKPGGVL